MADQGAKFSEDATEARNVIPLAYASPTKRGPFQGMGAGDCFLSGILVIVPFITGVMAIVLAVLAFRRGEVQTQKERWRYWLGAFMGVVNLVFWGSICFIE